MTATKGARIPYLDGLRAYSILLVLLGHTLHSNLWLERKWYLHPFLSNEALGPRIFFVLSGFLITTLLLDEQDATGRISIRAFYERRVARIFPVFYLYITVIGILTAIGIMMVPASSFFAALTFTWNLHPLWRHGGVEDTSYVLTHFWTLSVEEQFYLIWPSILVFLGPRWSRRIAVACIAGLPILRLAAYLLLPAGKMRLAIGSLVVQDMIMWGALGAFVARDGALQRLRSYRLRWILPWIGFLGLFVVGGAIWLKPRFGLDIYLLPSLQSFATIVLVFWLLSGHGGLLRRCLETWPMVQLGLLSYSLYVWQQPFTIWRGMAWLGFPGNVLLPLAVAIVSYKLVEVPLRNLIRHAFSQSKPAHLKDAREQERTAGPSPGRSLQGFALEPGNPEMSAQVEKVDGV